MARRTKEDAEQTRLAILDSALQIFYEKGFTQTRFDEIAKRIDLTKGAVYWHFRSKEDIVASLILQKLTARQGLFEKSAKIETLSDLRKAFIAEAVLIEQDEEFKRFLFFCFFQMEWSKQAIKNIWPKIKQLWELPYKRVNDCLAFLQSKGAINAQINVEDLTEVLMNLWNGVINSYVSGCKQVSFSENIGKGFDLATASAKMENK